MVERNGRVRARIIADRGTKAIHAEVKKHVLPVSMLYTDEWDAYKTVAPGYKGHRRIKHLAKIYVDGDIHTNTIEGFFGLLKNGIRGVYHTVSREYLQSYLNEYAWRYNHRHDPRPMFWTILDQVKKKELSA